MAKISMYDYIVKMFSRLPMDMTGTQKTPATTHSFNKSYQANKLPERKTHMSHQMVANQLYLCRSIRQDKQTAVEFLCARVQSPDDDN